MTDLRELTELRDGWAEPDPPSPTARGAARAALMRKITAGHAPEPVPRRHVRRLGWLVGGTVVTAAAAALAVVLSPAEPGQPAHPGQQQAGRPASPDELSGQQILLRAAEVAQDQPASTGAYWHVEQEMRRLESPLPFERYNDWTTRDGVRYSMPHSDTVASRIYLDIGFSTGGRLLTLEQVADLPTDPVELVTWLTDSYRGYPDEAATLVPRGLARLLWEAPAPPEVRSAALRALASLPNVTNLGAAEGGQALRVVFDPPAADKFEDGKLPPGAGEMTFVINPDTATLVSFTTYQGTTKVLSAGWTDVVPELIP